MSVDGETGRWGDSGTGRLGDRETRRQGDTETRGRGDAGTRGHGDSPLLRIPRPPVPASPPLRFSRLPSWPISQKAIPIPHICAKMDVGWSYPRSHPPLFPDGLTFQSRNSSSNLCSFPGSPTVDALRGLLPGQLTAYEQPKLPPVATRRFSFPDIRSDSLCAAKPS